MLIETALRRGRAAAKMGAMCAAAVLLAVSFSGSQKALADEGASHGVYRAGSVLPASADGGTTLASTALVPGDFTVLSESAGGLAGTVQVGSGVSPVLAPEAGGRIDVPAAVSIDGADYEVVAIAPSAFRGSSITEVGIPATVERIGTGAFANCPRLRSVDFAQGSKLAYVQASAFESSSATGALVSIRFPRSLKSIGAYAFHGQVALRELVFEGDTMERLGDYAFAQCTGLREVSLPSLSAESNAMGIRIFQGCTGLEKVVYEGDIASQAVDVVGTRHFEACTSLATVVYKGKKCLPTTGRYGGGGGSSSATEGFIDSNPTVFYTLRYYPSRDAAEQGADLLGLVCVRSDTPLSALASGSPAGLGDGALYLGDVLAPSAGYDCWAFEGGPSILDALPDSLYAYPADSHDIGFADISLDDAAFDYTGRPVEPHPVVVSAAGELLVEGQDYLVSYERKRADGSWASSETVSEGDLRVVVTGINAYRGNSTVEYAIARASVGSTFVSEGVTYCVVEEATADASGKASVGDGLASAVGPDWQGAVHVPALVVPDGSTLGYDVVSVARCAFGGIDAQAACTHVVGVDLPEGVREIGVMAFAYCTGLEGISIPASVSSIDARAFMGCTALESLQFRGSIGSLGPYAFAQCSALSKLELPDVSSLRDHAFAGCRSLVRVDFLGDVSGGDATQFADCVRLSRVVFHRSRWTGSFDSNPTCYFMVDFANAADGKALSLPVKADASLARIELPGTAGVALGAAIPGVPAPFGRWCYDCEGMTLQSACTAAPAGRADGASFTAGSGKARAQYRISSNAKRTVSYEKCMAKAKSAIVPASVSVGGVSYQVAKVTPKAFKGSATTAVVVKSVGITSFAKAFKSSKVVKVTVPKAKKKAYAKLLKKKSCGKAVKVAAK